MHNFCNGNISGIVTLLLRKEEMCVIRARLEYRYSQISTVPGTCSFHHFLPPTSGVIAAKHVSSDEKFCIKYDVIMCRNVDNVDISEIKVAEFSLVIYDEQFWIGMVLLIDNEQQDLEVNFMHPAFPAGAYTWPRRDDTCFVPNVNVAFKISAPITSNGRSYTLSECDVTRIKHVPRKQKLL